MHFFFIIQIIISWNNFFACVLIIPINNFFYCKNWFEINKIKIKNFKAKISK